MPIAAITETIITMVIKFVDTNDNSVILVINGKKVISTTLYNFPLPVSFHGSDVIVNNNQIFTC